MQVQALPHPIRVVIVVGLALAMAASAILVPGPVRAVAEGQKVVIIVGPVGSLSSNYRSRGDSIAASAEALGATVVKVYTPNATWANVKAAVNGANIIVYIGHGSGYPNPYGSTLLTDRSNGWGLNRIAGADSADPTGDGDNLSTQMVYCGEAAIEGKPLTSYNAAYCSGGPITPAPGFVMVFSNACYAPGAGETEDVTPTSQAVARQRVEYYSRPFLALGGSYFASDLGSRSVVEAILENPDLAFGDIFRLGNGYSDTAVRGFPHALSAGKSAWIQKTSGPGGLMSYWYAFAGDPARNPAGGTTTYQPLPPAPDDSAPTIVFRSPIPNSTGVSTTPTVDVRFDEAVLGASSGNTVLRDNATSAVVASSVTYNAATLTVSLVPNAPLMANRLYRMAVSGSIVDLAGNPVAFTQWYFTTGSVPLTGIVGQETFSPWRSVSFASGLHTGYLYAAGGAVTGTKTYSLASASGASASGRAVINGSPHVLIANGVWANYWVPESSRVVLLSAAPPPPPPPPPPPGSGVFDPPRTLTFGPATHTGYQFNGSGQVTASKTYTLRSFSSAATSQRTSLAGQTGMWFYVTNGIWGGYWIRESGLVYLAGFLDQETFSPVRAVSFASGAHTGYLMSSAGAVTGSKTYTLAAASGASASGRAVINGRGYLLIANGIWAGYWVPESSRVILY